MAKIQLNNGKNSASANNMGRFETEILTHEKNLTTLARLNGIWVKKAMNRSKYRSSILDMDSPECRVHGDREGSEYKG